jgi:hypothetical protein
MQLTEGIRADQIYTHIKQQNKEYVRSEHYARMHNNVITQCATYATVHHRFRPQTLGSVIEERRLGGCKSQ